MYQNIYIEKPKDGKPTIHLWDDKSGYQKFQYKKLKNCKPKMCMA